MLTHFADTANISVFILKVFWWGILIFYDCNTTCGTVQFILFQKILENLNLTKDLYSGQPALNYLLKVGLHEFKS